jgi:hypothetical protein|tara:strand:+ start:5133 stop:5330 length:198 start_codon:yes stop_codon:yes gene_type:complete
VAGGHVKTELTERLQAPCLETAQKCQAIGFALFRVAHAEAKWAEHCSSIRKAIADTAVWSFEQSS